MDKFEEYFRTTERYQDFLCWGSDKWIFKSVDGRYLSEEIQRMYELWQHQQAKVEELQQDLEAQREETIKGYTKISDLRLKRDELQKRVDSIKQLIQDYLSEEKELELKEWEQSTIYGRIAIELEQALKGGHYEEHRKKAEDAISNGASLTNHRIEL